MKDFRRTAGLGLALGIKLIAGLVAVKICAQHIGPESFGITGQIGSLINIVVLLAGGGIAIGLARVYADDQSTPADKAAYVKTARYVALGFAAFLMLLLIAANSWLQKTVLQGRNDAGLIITALIAAALPIALSGIGQGQNNGNQRADLYAGSMIGGSMLGLAGMWMLSHSYHATGALLGMIWLPTAQALPFFLISRFYSREIQKFSAVSLRKSQIKKNSKYLLSFGVLSISAGAIIPAALIAVRLMIEKNGDSSTLGLWQATTRISEAYTQLPLLILSVMLFARFASNASRPLSKKILLQTYTFMIGLMAVISISVLTLKSYWISIIFTPAFQGMSNFLPWQIAGDFARVLSYVGTTILAARGHVRLCVLGEVVQGLMLVSISHFFIPTLGSLAPFYAYILTYCIYLMLTLLLLRAKIKE